MQTVRVSHYGFTKSRFGQVARALQILAPFHQQLSDEVSNYLALSDFLPIPPSFLLYPTPSYLRTPSTATSPRVYTQWCVGIHGVSNYRNATTMPPRREYILHGTSAVLACILVTLHVLLSPSDPCRSTLNSFV